MFIQKNRLLSEAVSHLQLQMSMLMVFLVLSLESFYFRRKSVSRRKGYGWIRSLYCLDITDTSASVSTKYRMPVFLSLIARSFVCESKVTASACFDLTSFLGYSYCVSSLPFSMSTVGSTFRILHQIDCDNNSNYYCVPYLTIPLVI